MKNKHFMKLYFEIFESDLTPNESMILCFLLHWSELKKSNRIQISNEYMAKKLKISKRNVISIKKNFIEDGLIDVKMEPLNSSGKNETTYYLQMDEINRRFFEKEAQNEAENTKEGNYTTSTINAPIYPTSDGKNQECDDEVNVAESNPIEIDDNEDEINVIESTDFIVGNDDEDYFRELLREHVDLLACMSYDGLTQHKVAYDFLANSAIPRQRVDNILREERKRRMESKWKIA